MKKLALVIPTLAILIATFGNMACANIPQINPTATPSEQDIPPVDAREMQAERAEQATREWANDHEGEIAKEMIKSALNTAYDMDASYTAQITENIEVTIDAPELSGADDNIVTVPAVITSRFTIDRPIVGGTYNATLPISITLDMSKPVREMVIGYSVDGDGFLLIRE